MVPTLATGSAHGRLGPGEEAAALALIRGEERAARAPGGVLAQAHARDDRQA